MGVLKQRVRVLMAFILENRGLKEKDETLPIAWLMCTKSVLWNFNGNVILYQKIMLLSHPLKTREQMNVMLVRKWDLADTVLKQDVADWLWPLLCCEALNSGLYWVAGDEVPGCMRGYPRLSYILVYNTTYQLPRNKKLGAKWHKYYTEIFIWWRFKPCL